MTEVVTSAAAFSQLNLLASRQQGFGVSESTQQFTPSQPTQSSNALTSVLAAADKQDGASSDPRDAARDADDHNTPNHGPSKARVEIKQFNVGLSPSEVVGTLDALQRFDANGDGRVDLLESDRANLVRQKVFTFAALAAAPTPTLAVDGGGLPAGSGLSLEEAAVIVRQTSDALAAFKQDAPVLPKKYADADVVQQKFSSDETVKKYYAAAQDVAELGAPAGAADAPRKYYGQGAEVVAQAGTNNNGAPVKYADRVVAKDLGPVSEDGTGETKYYNRVAQTETGDASADAQSQKYYQKAQEVAASVQVAVYTSTAAITTETSVETTAAVTA